MTSRGGDEATAGILRAAGLRVTRSRRAVLALLAASDKPLTHAEVADGLAGDNIDRTTVYRNLMALVEADLVGRSDLGDRVWRYELSSPIAGGSSHRSSRRVAAASTPDRDATERAHNGDAPHDPGHTHGDGIGHPHFLCTECGSAFCLDATPASLAASATNAADRSDVVGEIRDVIVRGLCRSCT